MSDGQRTGEPCAKEAPAPSTTIASLPVYFYQVGLSSVMTRLPENGVLGNYGDSVFRWAGIALIEKSQKVGNIAALTIKAEPNL
jgi:hypothetical protein